VDDVVILARGQLVHESPLRDLVAMAEQQVRVTGPDLPALRRTLHDRGWPVTEAGAELLVQDATAAEVGAAVHAAGLELHGLRADGATLEEIFLGLVRRAEADGEPEVAA
jgi:ABC-2 type transport system ATP-binding protein